MKKFGERVKHLRIKAKMTQKQLAEKLKISESAVGMYERSEREPSFEIVLALSEIFNVTTDYLHGKTDKPDGRSNQNELNQHDDTYDSLEEINKLVKKYGIEDMGFFDIEQWKNLSPYDVQLIEEHFKTVVKLAKQRNKEK